MNTEFIDDIPIYIQVIDKIKNAIVTGYYKKDDKLPSVRDFSTMLRVNPNTIQRALIELENDGLITTKRTAGKFVCADTKLINNIKIKQADSIITEFTNKLEELGFTKKGILELMQKKGIKK